eukprot:sb/3474073/
MLMKLASAVNAGYFPVTTRLPTSVHASKKVDSLKWLKPPNQSTVLANPKFICPNPKNRLSALTKHPIKTRLYSLHVRCINKRARFLFCKNSSPQIGVGSLFKDVGVKITSAGARYIGAAIGMESYRVEFVLGKVKCVSNDLT